MLSGLTNKNSTIGIRNSPACKSYASSIACQQKLSFSQCGLAGRFIPVFLFLTLFSGAFFIAPENAEAQGMAITCPEGQVPTGTGLCRPADSKPFDPTKPATPGAVAGTVEKSEEKDKSAFQKTINDFKCEASWTGVDLFPGCAIKFWYYVAYMPTTFLLWIVALFFNAILDLTVNSTELLKSTFLSEAWGVVRDLSNIFFILILLYIAIQVILGLTHHGVKQMVAKVVVMALLINFSMFFTGVIIDSSNILAMVFYSKLKPVTAEGTAAVNQDGKPGAKDVSGTLYGLFDPTRVMTDKFFTQLSDMQVKVSDTTFKYSEDGFLQVGVMVGIIIFAVAFMGFAIYCFAWASIAFVGRLIELFILLVFSPFAFMSFTLPKLAGTEYIGWDAWFKRLLSVSFMAPIFMFFLYFIFMLVKKNPFIGLIGEGSAIQTILNVAIPGLVILILLLKATEFAKKGSGVLGEKLMQGAKMVGGLGLGIATGGASLAGTGLAGALTKKTLADEGLKKRALGGDVKAQKKLDRANYFATKSFDFRQTGMGKWAAKKSGMDFDKGLSTVGLGTDKFKGGRKDMEKREKEKHEDRKKLYHMSDTEAEKQNTAAEDWRKRYDAAMERAKAEVESRGGKFNEKEFSIKYEKGIEPRIKTSTEINKDRDKAYALAVEKADKQRNPDGSLKKDDAGKEIAKDIRDYWREQPYIKQGLAGAAVGLAVAGPLGAAVGGVLMPLTMAIKDLTKAKLKNVGLSGMTPEEQGAAIRKGENPNKEILKALKDMQAGKHVSEEKKTKVAEHLGGGSTPPPTAGPTH